MPALSACEPPETHAGPPITYAVTRAIPDNNRSSSLARVPPHQHLPRASHKNRRPPQLAALLSSFLHPPIHNRCISAPFINQIHPNQLTLLFCTFSPVFQTTQIRKKWLPRLHPRPPRPEARPQSAERRPLATRRRPARRLPLPLARRRSAPRPERRPTPATSTRVSS